MGDLISLRPDTLPVLCPRFDQVRVCILHAKPGTSEVSFIRLCSCYLTGKD
eukprot:gene15298-4580_t